MSEPESILDAKIMNLLQVVEQQRDRKCDEHLDSANRKAHEIVATAWREERERLHREIMRLREEVRRKLLAAEAQHQTRRRQIRQAEDQALLNHACDALREELAQRWRDASGRREWIDGLLRQAADTLLGSNWMIQHPRDWPAGERETTTRLVVQLTGEKPQFEPDERLDAGLRICSPGACVDGSLDGLLHDGTDVAAQLLAQCALCTGENE
jgi:hypothetical protein